jgi:hypothetical protein
MALTNRLPKIFLAVVASALTVTGVVVAATDSNPGGAPKDTLALNGYPPSSAQLLVSVTTGQAYSLSANVNVDFTNNSVEALVHFPMIFSIASVDLRLVNNHLYAGSAEATSGLYLAAPMKQPALYGLALEMTKPDIALITGFSQQTVSKNGDTTTYEFKRDHVAISNLMGGSNQPATIGSVDWSISVGSQGEVTQSTLSAKNATATTTIKVSVLSYNKKVSITAPSASQVKPVSSAIIHQLLGSAPLQSLLIPRNLTSLGQLRLN